MRRRGMRSTLCSNPPSLSTPALASSSCAPRLEWQPHQEDPARALQPHSAAGEDIHGRGLEALKSYLRGQCTAAEQSRERPGCPPHRVRVEVDVQILHDAPGAHRRRVAWSRPDAEAGRERGDELRQRETPSLVIFTSATTIGDLALQAPPWFVFVYGEKRGMARHNEEAVNCVANTRDTRQLLPLLLR